MSEELEAPWHVVPADDKKNARLIISEILLDVFKLKSALDSTLGRLHIYQGREPQLDADTCTDKTGTVTVGALNVGELMGRRAVWNPRWGEHPMAQDRH